MRKVLTVSVVLALASAIAAGCSSPAQQQHLSRDQLLDPVTCQNCHADHYRDWSGSMHAYASDDPVFVAMNKRGQRETNGQLGNFCVNCHAPMAVRDGKTTDGSNLATLEPKYKGVTCFFCHTVDSVMGDHNNMLHLSGDTVMRGPFTDPADNTAHVAGYSSLHDREHLDSAALCGSCHDVVNASGVAIERTYEEWKNQTVFSQSPGGDTCAQCHMHQSTTQMPVAQAPGAPANRYYHAHDFPGVDVALTPFPQADAEKQAVQASLDYTLQTTLCVGQGVSGIMVILDNVAAGHGWPSGAAQDRRAWIEVIAYSGPKVIYQSGVVPAGTPTAPEMPVTKIQDADLWLLRDCMLDNTNHEVSMFWQAQEPSETYQLPGTMTFNMMDVRYFQTHYFKNFPGQATLTAQPDRVTMRVRLQPIGLDVIDDLIGSGDLEPSVRASIPTFDLGTTPLVEWTPATANFGFADMGMQPYTCVTKTSGSPFHQEIAPQHKYCNP
jgi:hypothetical protein